MWWMLLFSDRQKGCPVSVLRQLVHYASRSEAGRSLPAESFLEQKKILFITTKKFILILIFLLSLYSKKIREVFGFAIGNWQGPFPPALSGQCHEGIHQEAIHTEDVDEVIEGPWTLRKGLTMKDSSLEQTGCSLTSGGRQGAKGAAREPRARPGCRVRSKRVEGVARGSRSQYKAEEILQNIPAMSRLSSMAGLVVLSTDIQVFRKRWGSQDKVDGLVHLISQHDRGRQTHLGLGTHRSLGLCQMQTYQQSKIE